MFIYNKKLQYPVRIANPNPRLAKVIISQYGGPDGELGASLRYLSQRYSMPFDDQKALLTDIGTEELGHLEMVASIVHQLTRKMTTTQIEEAGLSPYFVDHTAGIYPTAASGAPWNAFSMQVKGDPIADLTEDLAADATTLQSQLLKIPVNFNRNFLRFWITTIDYNVINQDINDLAS
jgi:spore coat protein JC